MPKFRQTIRATFTIDVEAEDMYEADAIISGMSNDEFTSKAKLTEVYNYDTSEFPEEL